MEYEIFYAKISTSEKLPDRFLNCQEKTTGDLAKAYMGKVYTLVEILSPWLVSTQVGQKIISTFTQSYYQGGSTSDLVNFEEALKKTNEALAQITQNGETAWIGNLNAILAAVVENKLHLAQTGKAEAYIFRDGKVNHVTYGLDKSNIDPHPLKTFSNVTSGEIKAQDKILIANPELLKHLDLESLRQIITLNSPNEAALQIAKILKKKKVKTVNLMILDLATAEEASRRLTSAAPNNIQLDKPLESIWANIGKFWRQMLQPILKFLGNRTKTAGEKSLKFTQNYLETLKSRRAHEPIKKRDIFQKEFIDNSESEGLLKDEEIKYSPELNVHYYEQARQEKRRQDNKFFQAGRFIFSQMGYILRFIGRFIRQTLSDRRKRPYALIVLAIIIFISLGLIINNRSQRSKNRINLLEAQNILKEAETFQKEAKMAALSNDQEKAKKLYGEAIDRAQTIVANPVTKQNALTVIEKSYTELDKLTATTRFKDLTPIASFAENAKAVFTSSGRAYIASDNEIAKITLNGGKPEKVATLPKNNGEFQFGTMSNSNIYLYTSSQKVYEFGLDSEKVNLLKIGDGSWETANAAAFYVGNLYLLDGIIGQIYKHPSGNQNFQKGEAYVNSPSIDIKNSRSLAIDGAIYVLKNNGEVIQLQKNKLQDFALKDLPTPYSKIENPTKIYTDSDTPSIYILDKARKRIVEFDKAGRYVHQYALPDNFEDIKDFTVSAKAKKIWLLNKGDLYEIAI